MTEDQQRALRWCRDVNVGHIITIVATLLAVGISWGALSMQVESVREKVAEHIGDTQRHQPILEHQEMTRKQIEAELRPLEQKVMSIEEMIRDMRANQQEMMRFLRQHDGKLNGNGK